MSFLKLDKRSIVFRLTTLIVGIIFGQAILLSLFLIMGGVLSQAEQTAFASFSEKVRNRKDYLHREMKYNWTNMGPYVRQISNLYDAKKTPDEYFQTISEALVSMLRDTQTTGAFVVLDDAAAEKPALYIRDYDPVLNDYKKADLYLVYGPARLANELRVPLDQMWERRIDITDMDSAFYEKPLSKASLSKDASLLGYWSLPFRLAQSDNPVITYSMPLLDKAGNPIGVIGVELSTQYVSKFLPSTDLQVQDSYGYMLGVRPSAGEDIQTILLTKNMQKRIIREGDAISYTDVDKKNAIYQLNTVNAAQKIYLSVENLGLYGNNTPFEQNEWYLIGMMNESKLLSYVFRIQNILIYSLIASAIVGVSFGYMISYKLTKPIMEAAHKVKQAAPVNAMSLEKTGLAEVDKLLDAIQATSNLLLETTGKMSRIVEMMGLPLAVFEYSDNADTVFMTDQLPRLLSLTPEQTEEIRNSKTKFVLFMQTVLDNPEEGEEEIYYIDNAPGKWLKIRSSHNSGSTIGVIMDMTEEMSEKKKIMTDRDIDPLTGIYNRKAMQQHMEETLYKRDILLTSALLMFDLDNLKTVNDTYGHRWGDIYIKHAVKCLLGIHPGNLILGRRSGDEFAALLYDLPSKPALRKLLDDFYRNIEKNKLEFPDGIKRPIAISAGLAWVEDEKQTFDEYLQKADELLYQAKWNKKGSYCE